MDTQLDLSNLQIGDHLCCLYETEEEYRAILIPFIRQGLLRGERVLYIVDARTAEMITGYLEADGFDTAALQAQGQLRIETSDHTYTQEGVFSPQRMIDLLASETQHALDNGYPALRITGEMTWALRGLPGSERWIEYEALLNNFIETHACIGLCQYDRRRFAPAVLLQVLYTHPLAVIGTTYYENFYYIPPEEFLGPEPERAHLEHWIANLAQYKRNQEALRDSQARWEWMLRTMVDGKKALATRERFLRTILQTTADGFWLLNDQGQVIEVNETYCRMSGYTREELLRLRIPDLEAVETPEQTATRIQRIIQNGSEIFETRHRRKDGSLYDVEVSVSYLPADGGRFICFCRDITERKRIERAAREYAMLLAASQEIAHVGSWELDLLGNRLTWSDEVYRIFGLQPQEFPATYEAFLETVHPEDRAAVDAAYTASLRDNRDGYAIEHRIVRKTSGEIRHVQEKCTHIRDAEGRIVRSLGIVQDITEQVRTEQALRESRASYQMLIELSQDMISLHSAEGVYLYASSGCQDLLGYAAEELIGRSAYELFHPEDVPAVETHHRQTLAGVRALPIAYRLRRKDGDYVWVETTSRYVQSIGAEGRGHILCITRDVSARKALEARLQEYTAHLEQLVAEKVRELEQERAKTLHAARLASLGEMATGVAHELNQPLTALLFDADYLKTVARRALENPQTYPLNPAELLELAENQANDVARCRRIIDHLRTFGRAGAGHSTGVALNQVIQDSFVLLGERLRLRNIQVEFDLAPDLPLIQANPHQLEQVFVNLVSNAEYALQEMRERIHSGAVTRPDYTPRVTLTTRYTDNTVTAIVRDNGCGILPEHRERIFQPFFTTKPVGEGTGLGLSISYGIVKEWGGEITFESAVNEGTAFILRFPVA